MIWSGRRLSRLDSAPHPTDSAPPTQAIKSDTAQAVASRVGAAKLNRFLATDEPGRAKVLLARQAPPLTHLRETKSPKGVREEEA